MLRMKLDQSILNRRDFLDGMVGAGLLGVGVVAGETALGYLTGQEIPEPDQVVVAGPALEALARDRFILVAYGPHPVLVFHLPDGELRALSAVCTHGQCNVRYRPKSNDIHCGCHGGEFTADGVNVPGTPPPRPLRRFFVRKQGDGTLLVSAKPLDPASQSGPAAERKV